MQSQQQSSVLAWHFLKEGSVMRDGKVAPADGVKLVFDGKPILCQQGLHASLQPFDALSYAPGPILCLVRCEGTIVHGDDKLVCTERTIVARIDATELLRKFARQQALKVLHLWDAPDIVVQYLQTGDDSLRADAYAAARATENTSPADVCSAVDAAADAACAVAAAVDSAYTAACSAAYAATAANSDRTVSYTAARQEFNTLVEEAFIDYLSNFVGFSENA